MTNQFSLVDSRFAVATGVVCRVTLAELSARYVRIRSQTLGGEAATSLMNESRNLELRTAEGLDLPLSLVHIGGTGMEDVCDWLFARRTGANDANLLLVGADTLPVSFRVRQVLD